MRYALNCGCGAALEVSATQAGSQLTCRCGREIDVPILSVLRRSAGQSPVPLNTIESIRKMILSGELPDGDICPYTGRPADGTILVHVQCESVWMRGDDSWGPGEIFLFIFLFGWLGALIAAMKSKPIEEFGRDTWIDLPLCISSDAAARLLRVRHQKTWKSLLSHTPIYADLLREFPTARVTPIKAI